MQHFPFFLYWCSATKRILAKCPGLVNNKKADGFTALHVAAVNDHYEVIKVLIDVVRLYTREFAHSILERERYGDTFKVTFLRGRVLTKFVVAFAFTFAFNPFRVHVLLSATSFFLWRMIASGKYKY